MNGFSLVLVGWPGALVAALAVAAVVGALLLQRTEIAHLPVTTRRLLAGLRAVTVVAIVALLCEPALAWHGSRQELPAVAILLDRSGSMGATDDRMRADRRLDEAVALGLVPVGARHAAPRRALHTLVASSPDTAAALAALTAMAEGRTPAVDAPALATALETHGKALTEAASTVESEVAVATYLRERGRACAVAATALRGSGDARAAATGLANKNGDEVTHALGRNQADLDAALIAAAGPEAPVIIGLAELDKLPRDERARRLIETVIRPAFKDRAELSVHVANERLSELGTGTVFAEPSGGVSDFAAPLSALTRSWSSERHVAAAILISDGRQTAGADPIPAVRALGARGAKLHTVCLGDPEQPRDAVVADLRAPEELFVGERLRLEAVWRVTGYDGTDWDLILSSDGVEVERRTVRASAAWSVERFERPQAKDDEAKKSLGPHDWSIRIVRAKAGVMSGGPGLRRDVWTGIAGTDLAPLVSSSNYPEHPNRTESIANIDIEESATDTGQRIRGYLVPPVSGDYVLWIAGDDQSELRFAPGPDAAAAKLVCRVPAWTPTRHFEVDPAQRSAPLRLEANRLCYIEVLHKQGSGGSNLALGWTLPDGSQERPIPASRYAPWTAGAAGAAGGSSELPEASLLNNVVERTVTVVDDPLKVLVLDAGPRWDVRYLISQFERDRRVQVVRRFRDVHVKGSEALLPVGEQALDAFDIIVLGDLSPNDLASDDQERLERFVTRRGGFLIVLSGPRGMPAAYGLGGVAGLLPVRPIQVSSTSEPIGVRLAKDGRHPITQIFEDPALNTRLWPALPRIGWHAAGLAAKPAAEVLLETDEEHPAPLVVIHRSGAGRVLWSGTDETWRWRDRIGERVHQTFWAQAVRWGLGARLRGADPRLQVALDRSRMEPEDTAELRVSCYLKDGTPGPLPTTRMINLDEPKGEPRSVDLLPVSGSAGMWQAGLAGLPVGRWRIEIGAAVAGDDLSEVRQLDVRRVASAEGADLSADPANLSRLANAGGGVAADPGDLAELVKSLASNLSARTVAVDRTWSLWDNFVPLAVVLLCLSADWFIRRRNGLP